MQTEQDTGLLEALTCITGPRHRVSLRQQVQADPAERAALESQVEAAWVICAVRQEEGGTLRSLGRGAGLPIIGQLLGLI